MDVGVARIRNILWWVVKRASARLWGTHTVLEGWGMKGPGATFKVPPGRAVQAYLAAATASASAVAASSADMSELKCCVTVSV